MNKVVKLEVPFIKPLGHYYCSERCAAMYIRYKTNSEYKVTPQEMREQGCEVIDSISSCIEKDVSKNLNRKIKYILIKSFLEFSVQFLSIESLIYTIKKFIDNKEPLIASIIPDTNWARYLIEDGSIEEYYHSIMVVGYITGTKTILVHDQRAFEMWDLDDFITKSARTDHRFVIRKDFLKFFPSNFRKI